MKSVKNRLSLKSRESFLAWTEENTWRKVEGEARGFRIVTL